MFDIQTIFNYYTSPFLAATFAWYAVMGFLVHVNVLMLLAGLPFKKIYALVLRYHVISLAIAYSCTPIVTGLFCMLVEIWKPLSLNFANYFMFSYFGWLMYWLTTIFSCWLFAQASCAKFKQSLAIGYVLMVVSGYFVLMLVQQNFGIVWF